MIKKITLSSLTGAALAAGSCFVIVCPQATATSQFIQKGMEEYNAGNYSEAANDLGAALATDFNNSVLHYYLGSSYIHMKQNDAAIREFKIAYALDPDNEVGKYSKQALGYLGVIPDQTKTTFKPDATKTGGASIQDSMSPLARSAANQLQQQADSLKGMRTAQQLPSSNDIKRQFDSIRSMLQPKHSARNSAYTSSHNQIGQDRTRKIQESADNLVNLMNEKAKEGAVHISPAGTNLYIRNYEMTPSSSPSATKATAPSNSR